MGELHGCGRPPESICTAYAWYYVLSPCASDAWLCLSDTLYTFYWLIFAVGLVGASLGGLVGGALRTWVGRGVRTS